MAEGELEELQEGVSSKKRKREPKPKPKKDDKVKATASKPPSSRKKYKSKVSTLDWVYHQIFFDLSYMMTG